MPDIPGFERHGFHHRLRIDLPLPEAEAVAEQAEERAVSPADVIRGIVRAWRRSRASQTPGGSSTPPGQT